MKARFGEFSSKHAFHAYRRKLDREFGSGNIRLHLTHRRGTIGIDDIDFTKKGRTSYRQLNIYMDVAAALLNPIFHRRLTTPLRLQAFKALPQIVPIYPKYVTREYLHRHPESRRLYLYVRKP